MQRLFYILIFIANLGHATDINVGVAANFGAPIKSIAAAFEQTSGHRINIVLGSTGALYAQIKNGAPLDVLLAADDTTPAKLEQDKAAIAGSRFSYAIGKLVVWGLNAHSADHLLAQLKQGQYKHLAIANPKLAPYGVAAMESLEKMDLLSSSTAKIVQGNNSTQVYQFVETGNAELGFVALSQVWKNGRATVSGSLWIVPDNYHTPIRQDAVLLKTGKDKPAASAFLQYLKSKPAQTIIQKYGYALP